MAQDIVPIELGLTAGDLVTLWAPRWREDGEEWEAFLGRGEELFAFPDPAHLAAFVRTVEEHDLADHPAWPLVPGLSAVELRPEDGRRYDLVGVPELVAGDPDTWVLDELSDVVAMLRSLADVCDLQAVHDVLDSTDVFGMLDAGPATFAGNAGLRRWTALGTVIAERWDEVLDAVDGVVRIPEVDGAALAAAQAELDEAPDGSAAEAEVTSGEGSPGEPAGSDVGPARSEDAVLAFWADVGIDPIRIVTGGGEYYTLRCYLNDEPLFLGSGGRMDVFGSTRALARHLADAEHDLTVVSTWPQVAERATGGELRIAVEDDNSYVLAGLADDLGEGPEAVDPVQLELAVELLTDAAAWAGDDSVRRALASSEPLGWLVSFVLRPDPTRLAPSPPFDAERAAWQDLVSAFEDRLRVH